MYFVFYIYNNWLYRKVYYAWDNYFIGMGATNNNYYIVDDPNLIVEIACLYRKRGIVVGLFVQHAWAVRKGQEQNNKSDNKLKTYIHYLI